MHNECNSEMEVDEICRHNETEEISFADVSEFNHPTSYKAIKSPKEAQAEIRKKKHELAAAEALVSNLRNEVKTLESSTMSLGGLKLENTRRTNKHRCSSNETVHKAKRMKDEAAAPNLTSKAQGSSFNDETSTSNDIFPATEKLSFSNETNTAREEYSAVHSENRGTHTYAIGRLERSQAEDTGPQTFDYTDQPTTISDISDSGPKFVPMQINGNRKRFLRNSGYASLDPGNLTCGPSSIVLIGTPEQIMAS
jgi:hypothetical protein